MAAAGLNPRTIWEHEYAAPEHDLAFFYGLTGRNTVMFSDYRQSRKVIYCDLGYWGRRDGGRFTGFHKLSLNDRHPWYYRKGKNDPSRFLKTNTTILPWKSGGREIIVAGMSDKGALAEGFRPGEWEAWAIAEVRKHTDRPIVYRPKPSWKGAMKLEGAEYQIGVPLPFALLTAHAVVCHHSNAAVESIVAGVPAFVWGGVAKDMGSQDLGEIENPRRPENREEWCNRLAWTQWSVAELATAEPWLHLKSEGVI